MAEPELFYIPHDENAMDVDNSDNIVLVSSEGLHVEGPIPFINPEIPIEQHAIIQIEAEVDSSSDIDRISPTISLASSRNQSPLNFVDESSNQSSSTANAIKTEPATNEECSRKRTLSDEQNDDDGRLCPICFDNWTNTGEHRVSALKCGHLFGLKCVERWLNSQKKKSCPTCKKSVKRDDIRYIYAKKLIAVDTIELEQAKKQLDLAMEENNRLTLDIAKKDFKEHELKQEIYKLKTQLNDLMHANGIIKLAPSQSKRSSIVRLYMDKSMEICKQNGCRVFDANCKIDMILTSMRSPTTIFSGYGLRKLSISQYKPLAFIPLHQQQIRDLSFHTENDWVLTASMDKTFKVVDTHNNSVISTTGQTMPLWSCCWDATSQYYLYVGAQSGIVAKYDIRQLGAPICTLDVPGDMSPVVSVASIPADGDLVHGGVVSCKLNSLWVFENTHPEHTRHALSLDGPFISMKYQKSTKQLLVSSRPNNRISYSRHTLCTLEKVRADAINCNVVHCFQGGGMQKLLSKSCFLLDQHQEYVAAHQESSKSVFLWSIGTGEKVCAVPAHESVLDLQGVQSHFGNFLVSLTEKKLEFFKFQ